MAIWQYRFTVIPKDSISSDSFEPHYDAEGLFEDDIYWSNFPTSVSLFQEFEKVLPKGKSWSKDLLLFGSQESNCLEVYVEDENVTSVSLRVDFSNNYEAFLRSAIEFVYLKGLLLLGEGNDILETNYLSIKEIIENSQQYTRYQELSSS